jgi:hypothetical protein
LGITLLNIHKPRDRSHYERFRHYHETFYRSVEVASVTPFSARALDKGFAGALVSLARHLEPTLTAPQGAEGIAAVRAALERKLLDAFLERVRSQPIHDAAELQERERTRPAQFVSAFTLIRRGGGLVFFSTPGAQTPMAPWEDWYRKRGIWRTISHMRSGLGLFAPTIRSAPTIAQARVSKDAGCTVPPAMGVHWSRNRPAKCEMTTSTADWLCQFLASPMQRFSGR